MEWAPGCCAWKRTISLSLSRLDVAVMTCFYLHMCIIFSATESFRHPLLYVLHELAPVEMLNITINTRHDTHSEKNDNNCDDTRRACNHLIISWSNA